MKRGRAKSRKTADIRRMLALRDMGVTMAHIGRMEKPPISRQRVHQLLGSKSKSMD